MLGTWAHNLIQPFAMSFCPCTQQEDLLLTGFYLKFKNPAGLVLM